ncbi:TLDc domain containing protein 2 [Rhizophagus clarus]|uniref:Restriction of telomere capping protein 5 n=1 Tax=Rhizophagus clarus TaxID=94130 RepID=A0A8H3QXI4_9GLOM|nr:TLDc domain containing protein 2 [Rhizophagus clarus]
MGQAWSAENSPPKSYSLQSTFENLASIKNGREVIEEEVFIQYLGFPDEMGIGPILYRSFTYLASYPSPAHKENSLTYDGLIIAIAIYCDKVHDIISEDRIKLIFESFATHEEHSTFGVTPKTGVSYEKKPPYAEDPENGVSGVQEGETAEVEPLKIESINLDDDAAFLKALGFEQKESEETYIVSKVPCTEIIKILTGIIWLMTNEINLTEDMSERSANIEQIRKVITPIVEHMAKYDTDLRNLPYSQIISSQTFIKWPIFKEFMRRNIPNVFNIFKPFFYGQFLIGQTLSQHRKESIMIGPHLPKLDEKSEFLNPINLAILSLMLPEKVLKKNEWNYLYSGSKHGFSMNRFNTHVFKYIGPTLMIIRAELASNRYKEQASPSKKEILIGAYIPDQWRSTTSPRTCFGSAECFLFELYPNFEVFPASNNNKNYIYYNPSFGIGFGGIATSGPTSSKIESMDANSFVIQLDNTLQHGRYRNDALRNLVTTYTLSVTRPFFDTSFEVLEIDVVGMGGEGVREKQRKEWKWENNESLKRSNSRKEGVDKEILKMAGVIDDSVRSEITKEP